MFIWLHTKSTEFSGLYKNQVLNKNIRKKNRVLLFKLESLAPKIS